MICSKTCLIFLKVFHIKPDNICKYKGDYLTFKFTNFLVTMSDYWGNYSGQLSLSGASSGTTINF